MPGTCWFVVAWLLAATPLFADWKITTVTKTNGTNESVTTRYYKGKLQRTDSEIIPGYLLVSIDDTETHRFVQWSPREKQYMVVLPSTHAIPSLPVQLASSPRPTCVFETHTTDSGDRAEIFGRTALHLITNTTQSCEKTPGGESMLQSEILMDGWYLQDSDLPPELMVRGAFLWAFNTVTNEPPIIKVSHAGLSPSGLAVRTKRTQRLFTEFAGRRQESTIGTTTEVIELYKGLLSDDLFEPPAGFKRVDRLPDAIYVRPTLTDEIEIYWNSFANWLLSWFS